MANFLSDIAGRPARAPRFGGVIGRRAKIQIPTGFAALDTLEFCQLPKGAIVIDGAVYFDALGTAMIFDVGYLGGTIDGVSQDPNAYINAGNGASEGVVRFASIPGLVDLGINGLDAERPLAATFTTVTTPTVGADLACVVQYILAA